MFPNTAYAQYIPYVQNNQFADNIHISGYLLGVHGAYSLLFALPLILLLSRSRESILLVLLLGCLVLTTSLNESIFGWARMDRARTTTHLAVISALGISVLFYHLLLRPRLRWFAPLVGSAILFIFSIGIMEPYRAGIYAYDFEKKRNTLVNIANAEDLYRPTVAVPDLGVISWHKHFNVIDLGRLGSPLMAHLDKGALDSSSLSDYLFDYAAPDIFAIHYHWSCYYYPETISDPRFDKIYHYVIEGDKHECQEWNAEAPSGIWIRADILKSSQSAERRLIDRMKDNLSIDLLRNEWERCKRTSHGREHDCIYVVRTAWRFLPEFRDKGWIDLVENIFTDGDTASFDNYLLTGYRNGWAHRRAVWFLEGYIPLIRPDLFHPRLPKPKSPDS